MAKRLAAGFSRSAIVARSRPASNALRRRPGRTGPSGRVTPRLGGAVAEPDQLQAGAAQVAGHARRRGLAGQHAERGVARLLLAGQDADLQPGLGGDALAEVRAVLGLAHGGGGGDEGRRRAARPPARRAKRRSAVRAISTPSGDSRPVVGRSRPRPGQHLFVEDGPDRPAFQPVEHQADRVGADVDDGRVARRRGRARSLA